MWIPISARCNIRMARRSTRQNTLVIGLKLEAHFPSCVYSNADFPIYRMSRKLLSISFISPLDEICVLVPHPNAICGYAFQTERWVSNEPPPNAQPKPAECS